MAQFYWTAEDYAVDAVPSDAWSNDFGVTSFVIKQDAQSRKYLEIDSPVAARAFLRYIGAGQTLQQDGQVWAKFMSVDGRTDAALVLRGEDTSASGTLTILRIDQNDNGNEDRLARFVNGTFGSLASKSMTVGTNTLGEMRGEAISSALKGRWWDSSVAEPATWGLEVTQTDVTDAGTVGVFLYRPYLFRVYEFGFGNEGDPAPTAPVTSTTDDLTANNISSVSTVSSPALAEDTVDALTATDVSSNSAVSAPGITQTHAITVADIESASQVSSPALLEVTVSTTTAPLTAGADYTTATLESGFDTYNFQGWPPGEPDVGWQFTTLTADGYFDSLGNYYSNAEHTHTVWVTDLNGLIYYDTVDNTGLAVIYTLYGTSVASTSEVSSPSLAMNSTVNNLTATSIQSVSSVTAPSVGQAHALAATDADSASSVGSPSAGQEHVLVGASVASVSSVSSPAVSAADHILAANDVQSASSVSTPALGQGHGLTAVSMSSESEIGSTSLAQVHQLLAEDVSSELRLTSPKVTPPWADTVPLERTIRVPSESRILAVPMVQEYTVAIPATSRIVQIPAKRSRITLGDSL